MSGDCRGMGSDGVARWLMWGLSCISHLTKSSLAWISFSIKYILESRSSNAKCYIRIKLYCFSQPKGCGAYIFIVSFLFWRVGWFLYTGGDRLKVLCVHGRETPLGPAWKGSIYRIIAYKDGGLLLLAGAGASLTGKQCHCAIRDRLQEFNLQPSFLHWELLWKHIKQSVIVLSHRLWQRQGTLYTMPWYGKYIFDIYKFIYSWMIECLNTHKGGGGIPHFKRSFL